MKSIIYILTFLIGIPFLSGQDLPEIFNPVIYSSKITGIDANEFIDFTKKVKLYNKDSTLIDSTFYAASEAETTIYKKADFLSGFNIPNIDIPAQVKVKRFHAENSTTRGIIGVYNLSDDLIYLGYKGHFAKLPTPLSNLSSSEDSWVSLNHGRRPGSCYAKSLIADRYETVTERVVVKPATTRTVIIPAQYKTTKEIVLIKDDYVDISVKPMESEIITDSIEVRAASAKWTKKRKDRDCLSANPDDCLIWALIEVPAEYKVVQRTVYKGCEEGWRKFNQNECVKYDSIPAEYITIDKDSLIAPASIKVEETSEAEYETIVSKRNIKKGGFTEWKEVLCADKIDKDLIHQIQNALNIRGYDCGTKINFLSATIKSALTKFQKDQNLPVGNLDLETLKALEIKE